MIPVRQIHQIEITSRCNLRCKYCPSPHLPRPKVDMTRETYLKALRWVRHFSLAGTQGELNLAGIGESTMHPDFVEFVHLAREALGWRQQVVFATNGLLVTDEMARAIAPAKPAVFVSLHRPEKAGLAVEVLRRHGLLVGVSADPSVAAIDWAGQVKWDGMMAPRGTPCPWMRGGWAFVLSTGEVSACCLDAAGAGVFGTLDDDVATLRTRPYGLCATCHHDVGLPIPQIKEIVAA